MVFFMLLAHALMMTFNKQEMQSDLQLLDLSRSGDHDAFGQLVGRHYRSCVNLATGILRDRAEAEEGVQQAICKAFEHLDQYLGEAEFFAWLFRIVINECRMTLRARKRARPLYLTGSHTAVDGRPRELLSILADPEHQLLKNETIDVLRTEIRRVPPLLREVIQLRDIEELPMAEVADRLGITIPAAKSRLLRARRALRERVMQRCGPTKHMLPLSTEQTVPARSTRHSWFAA
jgi:RNA polymerase sigma-70 factor (ECF subfamily)